MTFARLGGGSGGIGGAMTFAKLGGGIGGIGAIGGAMIFARLGGGNGGPGTGTALGLDAILFSYQVS